MDRNWAAMPNVVKMERTTPYEAKERIEKPTMFLSAS
jgi:hypothetical protein